MTFRIGLIGCGGMGRRHISGYVKLRQHFDNVDLISVCDLHEDVANQAVKVIQESGLKKPKIYTDYKDLINADDLDGVIVVTSTPMHHKIAIYAMENGLHVITEKPMGITMKACRLMEDSANKNQKIIAVAENYRRDPINRLSKALLDEGILGIPYFALDLSIGSSHRSVMHSTVWRAKKDQAGGIVLDAGVHNADMLLYLMGDADTVYAETRILENERTLTDMGEVSPQLAKMYKHRREPGYNTGDKVKQDAVDTGFALVKFKSGAIGQISITDASHGQKASISTITGSNGTLYRTESRSGNPIKLILFNGEEISGEKILDLVPNFKLDELTTRLWDGNSLIASYDLDFHETDARILAYEYMDWILSIQNGGKPEVGIPEGKSAIGLAYAIVESGLSESKIKVSDVISGKIDNYQKDIDISQNI